MNILKKLNLFIVGFIALSSYSCALPVNQIPSSTKSTTFNAKTNTITINESSNSASINFKLLVDQSDFSTKASSAGTTQGQAANVNKIRVILTTSNTDPLYSSNIKFDTTFMPNTSFVANTAKTYTISGLNTAGTYYVAIQLFNNTDNLVTHQSGLIGNTALSSSFSVSVNNGVISTSVSSVSIPVSLRNGIGAKIETTVIHNSGSSTLSAISVN